MSIFSKLFKKNTNTNFNLINLNDIIIFPKKTKKNIKNIWILITKYYQVKNIQQV